MNLYIIKYLLLLILEGEKTTRELSAKFESSISTTSHAMSLLKNLKLVKHPDKRKRSWEIVSNNEINNILEKLILVSKYNSDINKLLEQLVTIKTGSMFYKNDKNETISTLIASTGISRVSVINALKKLIKLNLLVKVNSKPINYYSSKTPVAQLFFESCNKIENLFKNNIEKEISPEQVIKSLLDNDSVLILIHYGSSARGKADKFSDIDLMVVTRDKISRGEILSDYSNKKIDLNVYSKKGFLQLLKTQPHFIRNISTAKVLKGEDIFKAIIQ